MAINNSHPDLAYTRGDTKNTYLYRQYGDLVRIVANEYVFKNGLIGGRTTWMEGNKTIFDPGKTDFTIEAGAYSFTTASWTISGYGTYVRDKGYTMSHSTEKQKTITGNCFVRSIKYKIDARDNETTLVIDKVGRFFEKARLEHLLPELDAYRLSSLANAIVYYNYKDDYDWDTDTGTVNSDNFELYSADEASAIAKARVRKLNNIAAVTNVEDIYKNIVNAINYVDDSVNGASQNMLLIINQKLKSFMRRYSTEKLITDGMTPYRIDVPIQYGKETLNYGWDGFWTFNGETTAQFYPSQSLKTKYIYETGNQGDWASYNVATDKGGYSPATDAKDTVFMYFPVLLPEAHIFYEKFNIDYLGTSEDSWEAAHRIEHDVFFAEELLRYGVIGYCDKISDFDYTV